MATISILNTSANLSGKTVLTAEADETITGLKTFSRGASAPFAVAVGGGNVANLDADKVDGRDSTYLLDLPNATNWATASLVWASYTPTWAASGTQPVLNNGTMTGRYLQIGKLVFFDISLQPGSTTTFGTGNYTWSLPVIASSSFGAGACPATILDSGTTNYLGIAVRVSATTFSINLDNSASVAGQTTPMTWANGDVLRVSGFYEAA